jgi:hypothetical protein
MYRRIWRRCAGWVRATDTPAPGHCDGGLPQSWGLCRYRRCGTWVVGWFASLSAVGAEITVTDSATNLAQQIDDAGVGENASKSRATIGESSQRCILCPTDSVEVPVDQYLDFRFSSGDGAENLSGFGFHFDIADMHLEMPLAVLATPDEGRIQRDHDRRRRHFRPYGGTLTECPADPQGMTPHGLTRSMVEFPWRTFVGCRQRSARRKLSPHSARQGRVTPACARGQSGTTVRKSNTIWAKV